MSLPRLAVAPGSLVAGVRRVDGEGAHHVGRVLRARPGDVLVLFDGAGWEQRATITRIDADALWLDGEAPHAAARPPVRLTLIVALTKADKLELVIQKATELGVAAIWPVQSAHAVVQLDGARAEAKVARWRKIAEEAARQSGRADVPDVADVRPLAAALAAAPSSAPRFLLHEAPGAAPLAVALAAAGAPDEVVVAVGPEGGFAPAEAAAASAAGFVVAGLGPRVLRAETAAIAACACVGVLVGDLARPRT